MGGRLTNPRSLVAAALLVALGTFATGLAFSQRSEAGSDSHVKAGSATRASAYTPKIKHYFVLLLENENADVTYGAGTAAPYLAKTLTAKGAFMPNYYATGHLSLDNYISMISGQGPNNVTQIDCQVFNEFTPATAAADGQYIGQGCLYPKQVQTVANQLEKKKLTWKGYMEDMAAGGSDPTCRHPAVGALDDTQKAEVGDQYAARHNPFVYFRSIMDTPSCDRNDVDLNVMPKDIKNASTAPSYAMITPNLCNDGHDHPCVDGQPGGLTSADAFLKEWVPKILSSAAYKDRGMLVITFDEAEAAGAIADSSSCCGQVQGPNSASNGGIFNPGPGGGRIGAVALSPCIKPGTVDKTDYNHYSQLKWVEQNFGLGLLGYADDKKLATWDGILNKPTCGQTATVKSVKPATARKGAKTNFTVKVKAQFSDCTAGVTVKVGGKSAKTNKNGVAKVKAKFGSTGRKTVTAKKPGCATGKFKIKIKSA